MADGVTVKVRRKDKLFAKLRRTVPALSEGVEAAGKKSADEMVATAKRLAPVKTGALRDSIIATPGGKAPPAHSQGGKVGSAPVPDGAVLVTAGNTSVRYPHLVEFGTPPHTIGGVFAGSLHPGTAPQPFFFPAFRLVRRKHKGRITRAVSKALKNSVAR